MSSEPPPSEDIRAFALAGDLRTAVAALSRRLREQATSDDLTGAQKSVLRRLELDGPATGSALARAEAMRPQSMGAIVAALEAAGYVSCAPDPSDGRQTIVSLTERFKEWLGTARSTQRDWLFRAVQTQLSPAEQERLADAIGLLGRLIEF